MKSRGGMPARTLRSPLTKGTRRFGVSYFSNLGRGQIVVQAKGPAAAWKKAMGKVPAIGTRGQGLKPASVHVIVYDSAKTGPARRSEFGVAGRLKTPGGLSPFPEHSDSGYYSGKTSTFKRTG